ncbi:response regulator transcription factor, partial [Streptomyces sp. NPDC014622]|uniref:response regulator transcription factor n=1 Tax=Streptomyces sp. NPDC014622 TaxID=3364874 RepID=UPI0036F53774
QNPHPLRRGDRLVTPRPHPCHLTSNDMGCLTPREVEVLVLIADGLSNPEIARRLHISQATVKSHINNLFAKAGVRDRAQAVRYAYVRGFARPPGPVFT